MRGVAQILFLARIAPETGTNGRHGLAPQAATLSAAVKSGSSEVIWNEARQPEPAALIGWQAR